MQLDNNSQPTQETSAHTGTPQFVELNFDRPLKPIAELVVNPEFPHCALGEFVDCGGYSGVVVEIGRNSIKVRSQEGSTRSYNINGLRKLYAPRVELAPLREAELAPVRKPEVGLRRTVEEEEEEPAPEAPPREVVAEPDFNQEILPIAMFASDPEFPKCIFGKLIDFGGFTGVVVEIVNGSLKVRSKEETTRSYNIRRVQELHGRAGRGVAGR